MFSKVHQKNDKPLVNSSSFTGWHIPLILAWNLDQEGRWWAAYAFWQKFSHLGNRSEEEIHDFVAYEMPKRMIGNSSVLICGETNAAKYSQRTKRVHNTYDLRAAIL